jgi:hypothetical protein
MVLVYRSPTRKVLEMRVLMVEVLLDDEAVSAAVARFSAEGWEHVGTKPFKHMDTGLQRTSHIDSWIVEFSMEGEDEVLFCDLTGSK